MRAWVRAHRALTAVGFGVAAAAAIVLAYFQPQALLINNTVHDPLPVAVGASPSGSATTSAAPAVATPESIGRGVFRSLEHQTSGSAVVLRLADGSLVIRLEAFNTSSGPDVHVTLSPALSTGGDRDFATYLDLGSIKGNHGEQNYAVPAGTDIGRYRSVVIWCKRFSVGFGVAPIE